MNVVNKEKILELARAFVQEGKLDRAIREYEKIVLADPSDLRVKLRMAELYTKRKQVGEAIRIYREVAQSYSADGFFLKAVTVYKNILRLNPSMMDVNEALAGLYERMGLKHDAIRQYDILASALDMRAMIDRVFDIRAKIVSLDPDNGVQRVRLAELYQREGKIDEAINQYEEYARQLEREGRDQAKLADVLEKVLAHRPERHDLVPKLIAIYNGLGETKKTLQWLEAGGEVVENDAGFLKLAAELYIAQNQNDTARAKLMRLAEVEEEAGQVDEALDAYVEILALFPDEEDRFERTVEAVKSGAMPDVVARAAQRRQVLEEEEIRRQEEETTGRTAMSDVEGQDREKGKTQGKRKAKSPVSVETKAAPEAVSEPEPEPEPEQKPEPKPVAPAVPPTPPKASIADRHSADAAFNLAQVYRRTGLVDEARAQLERAQQLYRACRLGGLGGADVDANLNTIESWLSGREPSAVKSSIRPDVAEITAPPDAEESSADKAQSHPPPKPSAKPKPKEEAKEKNKKKISFV